MIHFNKDEFTFNELPHVNVTLYSESANNSNHLLISGDPSDPSTSAKIAMKLPSPPQHDQWLGWNTSIRIYNLLDNRTWNENPGFSSGSDDGPPSVDQEDGVSYFHNDTISNWDPDYFEDPTDFNNDMTFEYDETNDYVNMTFYGNKSGNNYGYNVGEYVGIRQDGIDLFRGAMTNAWIRLIYDPVYMINYTTSSYFDFTARINEKTVYRKTSIDLRGLGLLDTGWVHSQLWQNVTPVFPPPSANGYSDFNLSLRISYTGQSDFLGYNFPGDCLEYQRIQVHGVYLAIEARAQPNSTDIQLEVNNRAINGTFGDGNIQWVDSYPNSVSDDPYDLLFNSSSADNNIDLSFDVDVSWHVFKFKGTTKTQNVNDLGVQFSVDPASNKIKYKFYLYAYWDFSNFFNFYFNYSIPRDWNISLVKNPALAVIYNRTAGYNLGIIGGDASDGYVLIPTRNGTGDPVAELPGWWYFEAEGPNYITAMEIEKKVGASWISSTTFNSTGLYDGDLLRVKATINNQTGVPPDIQNSLAYLKVILPNGTTLITRENNTINVTNGEATFEPFILAGVNTTGGIFQAQVYWNHSYDYFSGYEKVITPESYYFGAGYDQMNFTVMHDSNLKIINPLDAQADSEADLNYFDIFTLKMFLNDTDSNVPIPESSVIINWSGILALTESAGGLYSTSLDTTDLGSPGIYYIRINSSKNGFYNTTTIMKLNVIAESVLETLTSPPPGEFGSNFTVQMFYHLPGDDNYNYSSAALSVSTAPTSGYLTENVDYTYTDLLNGTYEIAISTGITKTLNETGEEKLYVHSSKAFIDNATREITLYIDPTPSKLTTNQSIFTAGFFENITMYVNYTIESDASPILGATLGVTGHGSLPFSINEIGNGIYAVEFNSSSTVNTYDIIITASKTNYMQKSVNFLLSVDAADSTLDNVIGITPKILSENVSLLMFYYKPGDPTQNYTAATLSVSLNFSANYLQENIDFLFTNNLNGTYTLILYTGTGTNFDVIGQHSVYVHATQTYIKNASIRVDIFLDPYTTSLTANQTLFTRRIYENVTLYVNYTKTDSTPILGANINISGHGSLSYSIGEVGLGIYSIEFNASSIVTTYNIIVTASKTNHEQKSVSFTLIVDEFESTLDSLKAVTPKTLSENITYSLFYYEPGNPLQNYTGAILSVSLNLTSNFLVENIDFIYFDNLNGTYSLILYTGSGTNLNETGQYSVYVHASRTTIKNASRKIDIFLEAYPAALTSNQTIFLSGMFENLTLFVNYTLLSDSSPIPGASVAIIGQESLPYTIYEIGGGIYAVELNTSGAVKTYNIIVTVSKTNYEQKSINFLLSVDASESTLDNLEAMIPKALSENITMTLFYYEPGNPARNYTGALIQMSMNLTSDYLIENVDFIVTDNFNGTYSIILYTGDGTRFNTTGQNSVYAHASKLYIKNASLKVDIFLNPYAASLISNQTLFSSRFNENVTFFINYTRVFDSAPILGANVNISGQEALSYTIGELGNGLYSIELNSSTSIDTYNIIITASKINYEVKSITFILSVDEFESTLESLDAITPKTLSENISLRLFYYDPINPAQNYTGALIEVSMNLSSDFLIDNIDYIKQDNGDGTYNLTLYTGMGTRFNETGQYSCYVHASRLYVKNASRKIDLFLNAYATNLTTNQNVFTKGMYENVTLTLNYTLLIDSSPILNANVNVTGLAGLMYQTQEVGNGVYTIEINTSNVKTSYDILVILSKTNYEQKSQSFILSVSEYNTNLETNHSQIIQAQSNQNVTLYVNYTREDGTPIDNANFYILGITLDYNKYFFGAGIYGVEINVSDQFANYDVILVLNKTNYKQKSLTFIISVNVLDSTLEVLQGQSLINFRENLTLLVIYSSPMDQNINYTQATINISSAIDSNYWVENLHYLVTNNLNGTYSLVIFTGESVKINESGQNIFHIHAVQPNVRNATRSYSFFINPIQTEILANQTVFEIPKYESINFTVKYQTELGAQPLDNASIVLYGISNYSIQELSPGLYEIVLEGGNETKSYSISLVATKQNYGAATLDLVLIVRSLDQYTNISVSPAHSTVTVGETSEFAFTFYYEYTGQYLTDQNITVTYQWAHGSGNLTMKNATHFMLEINTENVPSLEYQITIYVYDQGNNLFAQRQVTLTVNAKPIPPWIYTIMGAAAIAIFILAALVYYNKRYKPKRIFKNKALMDKYSKYLDAHNLQHLIVTFKDSGVRINSRTYGKETEVDDDLISGFLTALSSFGTELTGVATAMENIKYKGSKLLLEDGNYINSCLVLNEEESPNLKSKALQAIELFEEKYKSYLEGFTGEVGVFDDSLDIYDDVFEIYLTRPFKMNFDLLTQRSKAFNQNKKEIMRIILSKIQKKFTLQELFELIHKFKIKLEDPEIFAELYDLIQMGIFTRYIPIESLKYPPKED